MSDQSNAPTHTPLAIIGMGALFPKAADLDRYWSLVKRGVDAIVEVPESHWRPEDFYSDDQKKPDFTYGKRGGFLEPHAFDPLKYGIPPNVIEATDTSQLLGLVAAEMAMQDAGYGLDRAFDRDRVSVILGVTGALELVVPLGARLGHPIWRKALKDAGLPNDVIEDAVQRIADGYVSWQENSFPGLLGNVVAGRISKYLNTGATNCVVDAACASSLSALHLAALELSTGKIDMAITGGVDTFNDIFMYMCFSKTPALSPTGNSKPFDKNGDGTILGEGLGMMVIKRLADAERDGDKIYAVIRGVGSSSDGKGEAIYAPSSPGQVKALRDAYRAANVDPRTIELVEAHGTGTAKGDAVEVRALREVYGASDNGPWCALGSVKSQIGHTKAAAGSAGLIKAALALHYKVLPPTLKVNEPLDVLKDAESPFYVNTSPRPWVENPSHPRRAGVSSFGFGGSNFHAVLEEYTPKKAAPDSDGTVQIIALSAPSFDGLRVALKQLPDGSDWTAIREAAHASRASFDANAKHRLLIVIEKDSKPLGELGKNALASLEKNSQTSWSSLDGIYYGCDAPQGKLAFVFPGQGAQYTGMLRDLACEFPEMLDTLNLAGQTLVDRIYPHPKFTKAEAELDEEKLRATDVAQPAIGTVSLGASRVLAGFRIAPEAVAGHSYGELTALCAAGVFTESDFIAISRLRGELMNAGGGDKGTMLAVRAPLADIEAVIADAKLDVIVANKNAPDQSVLSGTTDAINRAFETIKARKMTCTKIPVAAAFHSKLVADAAKPFHEALIKIAFATSKIPVYSNTTAGVYPSDANEARALLANQLANPVEFVREIESMYESGIRTFVEVGPGARMTGLVKAILADRAHTAIAIDAANGKKSGIADLAKTLAALAAEGRAVSLRRWDDSFTPAPKPADGKKRMTVPLTGANYRTPKPARPPKAPIALNAAPSPKSAPTPVAQPAPAPAAPAASQNQNALFQMAQANIAALQQMQEQTARLHQQFLAGQEQAAKTFQMLLEQQRQSLFIGATLPAAAPHGKGEAQRACAPEPPQPVEDQSHGKPDPTVAVQPSATLQPILLEVVAEKTGYPIDMLELSMSLDADLGIDSIKRVEILSALQERIPSLPSIEAEELSTIQTLQDIADKFAAFGEGEVQRACAPEPPRRVEGQRPGNTPSGPSLQPILLEVVADKTGYPVDMLELSMSLDADLGIDSIKRVEILSALQERVPGLPAIEAEVLGTLHTLQDVIDHTSAFSAAPAAAAADAPDLTPVLLEVVADKTGYPVDMLELSMSLDADLGIDSIKRVEILSAIQDRIPSLPQLEAEAIGQLHTLADVAAALSSSAPLAAAKPTAAPVADSKPAADEPLLRQVVQVVPLTAPRTAHPIRSGGTTAVICAPDDPFAAEIVAELETRGLNTSEITSGAPLDLLIVVSPIQPDDPFIKKTFSSVQSASKALRASKKGIFATVSRLGGTFGFESFSETANPLNGALAGLAKTASHEWPDVVCRAIDLAPGVSAAELVDELQYNGPIETGITDRGLVTLELAESTLTEDRGVFGSDDVIVVSGGARGVTAEVVHAIATVSRASFVLLGRSAEPQAEESWLRGLTTEAQIKQAIAKNTTGKLSPREIGEQTARILAERELAANLNRLRATGSKVLYAAVDVTDKSAVRRAIDSARQEFGPITAIIHGAGVLADRLIEDKTSEQFARVYDTKVLGLRALLNATQSDPLKAIVLFSSSTGRFGRKGQSDYAIANEALNKTAQFEARHRANCRVVSVNWGPWDGGMVTPELRKLFAAEGVGVIPLKSGAEYLLSELAASNGPAEVVILGPGSKVAAPKSSGTSRVLEVPLSLDRHAFLASHLLDGKPVLPVAIYVEWFAHAALHDHPGLRFVGLENLRVFKGVVLEPGETRTLEFHAAKPVKDSSGAYRIDLEMRSGKTLHAGAIVVLAPALPKAPEPHAGKFTPGPFANNGYYDHGYLFHGPHFRGVDSVNGCDASGIEISARTAPRPSDWIKDPLRKAWLVEPLVLDCAFQALILWSHDQHASGSLPVRIGRYTQFVNSFPKGHVIIRAAISEHNGHKAIATIDFINPKTGALVARMEDYECVIDASLNDAFQRSALTFAK